MSDKPSEANGWVRQSTQELTMGDDEPEDEPTGAPDETGTRHRTLSDLKERYGGENGGDGRDD